MKKFVFYALLVYFLSASLNLMAIHFQHDIFARIFKIILMPALICYLFFNWSGKKQLLFFLIFFALLFSWFGDIILTFQGQGKWIFTAGLGAFLVTHILYIIAYKTATVETSNKANRLFTISRILIFLFVGIALDNALWNKIGNLRFPIGIYTVVIITMAIFAVLRREKTSPSSFSFVYAGALMFIVSDGMIVISKFINPFPYNGVLIMLTYILAQFFITSGLVKHKEYLESEEEKQ